MKEGKIAYYIDGKDDEQANWLKYVNCSRTEDEQNLFSLQYHGSIYYRVYKPIQPGDELLVWYGEEYARDLGIDISEDAQPLQNVSEPGMSALNVWIFSRWILGYFNVQMIFLQDLN